MTGHTLPNAWRTSRVRLLKTTLMAWRAIWRLDDELRSRVHGRDCDLPWRPRPKGRVSLPDRKTAASSSEPVNGRVLPPRFARIGVLAAGPGMPAAGRIAEVLGLQVVEARPPAWGGVVQQAIAEQWPLLVLHLGAHGNSAGLGRLQEFVRRGGEVLVVPEPEADWAALGRVLDHELPALRRAGTRAGGLSFSSREPELTSWFTGVTVSPAAIGWCLGPAPEARPLAWTGGQAGDPVLTVTRIGEGAVFTSAAAGTPQRALRDLLAPSDWPAIVPPLLLMRRRYGDLAWHAPVAFANVTIDDPALTGGHLGLDYRRLVDLADEGGYHVTIATIPRELDVADACVLRLLARRRDRVSACYHGWSHRGYEFFLPESKGARFRARPLEEQERAIERAAAAGRRFWRRTGFTLDRVMVFPHGIAPAATLSVLSRHGFVASCNLDDRDPLAADPPSDPHLGLRPADTAWADVPLLWRRGLDDPRFLIDIGLGRPLLSFGHRRGIGSRLELFADYAGRIGAAVPDLRWGGLETVARHAYLVRRDPAAGWQVLMSSDRICLHNDGHSPRRYTITRPHLRGQADLPDPFVEVAPGEPREVCLPRAAIRTLPSPGTTCRPAEGAPPVLTHPASRAHPIPAHGQEISL